jgi:hypothetical protein
MTIAISLKINDGLVLAADSASTVLGMIPTGELQVINVYNNVSKLFNLRKGLPIGAVTWGAGSIGQASISTIVKDLRERFTGGDRDFRDWELKKDTYNVEAVARRLREFVFDDLYAKAFSSFPAQKQPALGFIVAGYSADAAFAEEFKIDIQNGECSGPTRLRNQDQVGVTWAGDGEALNRLIVGTSGGMPVALGRLGIPASQINQAMATIQQSLQVPLVLPAMPLQDAIELAEFMVDVTIRFSRFMPGAQTVGGPIEVAAISKHEGFRWIRRKYYFNRELNPEERFTRTYEPSDGESGKASN